jgi:hypothetical protein
MTQDPPELPCGGDHEFGQGGRCECGMTRDDLTPTPRRSGGAGARTSPLTDREYRKAMRELAMGEE